MKTRTVTPRTEAPTAKPLAGAGRVVPPTHVAKPLGGPDNPVDFSQDPRFHDVFYGDPTFEQIHKLSQFLRADPNRFVRLYHGTSAAHPIMAKGLLPTCASRAKSLQSAPGFVYLSVYPGMAEDFARMAYPSQPVRVYAVTVTAGRLLADLDQLRNKRLWSEGSPTLAGAKNTLAESLAVGHAARVRGKVEPYQIQPLEFVSKGGTQEKAC